MSDGAQITQTNGNDPRLSTVIRWGAPLLGVAFLSIAGWIANRIANNLSDLNETATKLVVQNAMIITRLDNKDSLDDQQNSRLSDNERAIATIEGRVFRGVDGYEKEPRRGH